jgi:ribonuclease HI
MLLEELKILEQVLQAVTEATGCEVLWAAQVRSDRLPAHLREDGDFSTVTAKLVADNHRFAMAALITGLRKARIGYKAYRGHL